jgi:hypothetical protein
MCVKELLVLLLCASGLAQNASGAASLPYLSSGGSPGDRLRRVRKAFFSSGDQGVLLDASQYSVQQSVW